MPDDEWNYRKAGLDLEKYAESMAGIAPLLARSSTDRRVIAPPFPPRKGGKGSGGFASLFDFNPDGRFQHPVLVTCTDGVGSKLKIASALQKYDTVGIDLVAMSVNDLICTGGEPLVFLDYLAMPKDDPELTTALVRGISEGCMTAGCALVGGETAILPDFYADGDFDMAGFCSGIVEKERIVDGRQIRVGHRIVGVASSGLHSNGYSLVRKLVFEAGGLSLADPGPEPGRTVGETLLTPTRIYVREVRSLLDRFQGQRISGLAHITGGGLRDNVGRILPPDMQAVICESAWSVPAVFLWLQGLGNVAVAEMRQVFNLGIGFVVICEDAVAESIVEHFACAGSKAWVIGEIVRGDAGVIWV